MKSYWKERQEVVPDQVELSRQYYLYSDDTPYRDRLLAICRDVMSGKGTGCSLQAEEKVDCSQGSGQAQISKKL